MSSQILSFFNIGGKVNPNLAGTMASAKAQVIGLTSRWPISALSNEALKFMLTARPSSAPVYTRRQTHELRLVSGHLYAHDPIA